MKWRCCVCVNVETVQVRSELDERCRLGGVTVAGRAAGEESRGAR